MPSVAKQPADVLPNATGQMTDDQLLRVRVCAVEYQWMGDDNGFWDKEFDHETVLWLTSPPSLPYPPMT